MSRLPFRERQREDGTLASTRVNSSGGLIAGHGRFRHRGCARRRPARNLTQADQCGQPLRHRPPPVPNRAPHRVSHVERVRAGRADLIVNVSHAERTRSNCTGRIPLQSRIFSPEPFDRISRIAQWRQRHVLISTRLRAAEGAHSSGSRCQRKASGPISASQLFRLLAPHEGEFTCTDALRRGGISNVYSKQFAAICAGGQLARSPRSHASRQPDHGRREARDADADRSLMQCR